MARNSLQALAVIAVVLSSPLVARAESLVAAATIRANTVIAPEHLAMTDDAHVGALQNPSDAIGMEARVVLFAGRPIRPTDLGPPALVERNQIVLLVYQHAGLTISSEGRALGRAAAGEVIRVINLSSRSAVTGTVDPTGHVLVGPSLALSLERP